MASPAENFIRDLGALAREAALAAAEKSTSSDEDRQFESGRAMAWYEVTSLIQQQAAAFGLSPSQVGLEGFDAERDLLGRMGSGK
jgi:hypothetical protein